MNKEKIIEFAKQQGYIDVLFLCKWNGYDCYEPLFNEDRDDVSYIGLPFMIMVKGEIIRLSTSDEALKQIEECSS